MLDGIFVVGGAPSRSAATWSREVTRARASLCACRKTSMALATSSMHAAMRTREVRGSTPAVAHARSTRARTRVFARASVSASGDDEIDALNAAFAIKDSVRFARGNGGLPVALLTHKNGCTSTVYLFGACVTSWTQKSGDEVLYVRPDAAFDKTKPIGGGAPLCFPQFGPGAMQQHGFARNCDWEVIGSSADVNPDDPEPAVMLALKPNDFTRSMWDEPFEATYEVTLRREKLKMELCVKNTSQDKPIDFTAALHTYIEVTDCANSGVFARGLMGKTYLDKNIDPINPPPRVQDHKDVFFGLELCDRIYLDTDPETLLYVGSGAAVAVENTAGWMDTVVWNPHLTMKECYKNFCCIESAAVGKPVVVQPGKVWRGETNLSVIDV